MTDGCDRGCGAHRPRNRKAKPTAIVTSSGTVQRSQIPPDSSISNAGPSVNGGDPEALVYAQITAEDANQAERAGDGTLVERQQAGHAQQAALSRVHPEALICGDQVAHEQPKPGLRCGGNAVSAAYSGSLLSLRGALEHTSRQAQNSRAPCDTSCQVGTAAAQPGGGASATCTADAAAHAAEAATAAAAHAMRPGVHEASMTAASVGQRQPMAAAGVGQRRPQQTMRSRLERPHGPRARHPHTVMVWRPVQRPDGAHGSNAAPAAVADTAADSDQGAASKAECDLAAVVVAAVEVDLGSRWERLVDGLWNDVLALLSVPALRNFRLVSRSLRHSDSTARLGTIGVLVQCMHACMHPDMQVHLTSENWMKEGPEFLSLSHRA